MKLSNLFQWVVAGAVGYNNMIGTARSIDTFMMNNTGIELGSTGDLMVTLASVFTGLAVGGVSLAIVKAGLENTIGRLGTPLMGMAILGESDQPVTDWFLEP